MTDIDGWVLYFIINHTRLGKTNLIAIIEQIFIRKAEQKKLCKKFWLKYK